jgi:hypothetical protein
MKSTSTVSSPAARWVAAIAAILIFGIACIVALLYDTAAAPAHSPHSTDEGRGSQKYPPPSAGRALGEHSTADKGKVASFLGSSVVTCPVGDYFPDTTVDPDGRPSDVVAVQYDQGGDGTAAVVGGHVRLHRPSRASEATIRVSGIGGLGVSLRDGDCVVNGWVEEPWFVSGVVVESDGGELRTCASCSAHLFICGQEVAFSEGGLFSGEVMAPNGETSCPAVLVRANGGATSSAIVGSISGGVESPAHDVRVIAGELPAYKSWPEAARQALHESLREGYADALARWQDVGGPIDTDLGQ